MGRAPRCVACTTSAERSSENLFPVPLRRNARRMAQHSGAVGLAAMGRTRQNSGFGVYPRVAGGGPQRRVGGRRSSDGALTRSGIGGEPLTRKTSSSRPPRRFSLQKQTLEGFKNMGPGGGMPDIGPSFATKTGLGTHAKGAGQILDRIQKRHIVGCPPPSLPQLP